MQLCSLTSLAAPEPQDVLQDKELGLYTNLGRGFGSAPSGQERKWMENVTSIKSCTTEVLCRGAHRELGVWKICIILYRSQPLSHGEQCQPLLSSTEGVTGTSVGGRNMGTYQK